MATPGKKLGSISSESRRILDAVQSIISIDNPTTKRFLLYKLISLGILESTRQDRSLRWVITRAQVRGELPDEAFVDHKRRIVVPRLWSDAESFKSELKHLYKRDLWADQPQRVLILVEKTTIEDQIRHVTFQDQVPLVVSTGYFARKILSDAAEYVIKAIDANKTVSIGYIGDYDPSGLDMERAAERGSGKGRGSKERHGLLDILDQRGCDYEGRIEWERIAITQDNFESLPSYARIPIKDMESAREEGLSRGDPRAEAYQAEHGDFGCEVEALTQEVLQEALQEFIDDNTDVDIWNASVEQSNKERDSL